jgi:hypothetical protein
MRQLGRVKLEDRKQAALLKKVRKKCSTEVSIERPLFGGLAWMGEQEALEATSEMVEHADRHGPLRSIIEAIKSNRVEEDFSPIWSFAREDFERKLYRKRNKVKIQFVQLDDTIPTHGPDAEVHENRLWQSLFAVLNPKERRIVICLRSGVTKLTDVATLLGYANHSAVSKALKKIPEQGRNGSSPLLAFTLNSALTTWQWRITLVSTRQHVRICASNLSVAQGRPDSSHQRPDIFHFL